MRVQRAPHAADQPARPPAPRVPSGTGSPGFSAHVDLDLTDLLRRLDESQVVAEVLAQLVAACRQERLIDDDSAMRYLRLTDEGFLGAQFDGAVNQSAYAIGSGLKSLSTKPSPLTPRTLTVVHLDGTRVHAAGDWGWEGLGVVTLGRIVPTLVPAREDSLSLTQRWVAQLGFTVPRGRGEPQGVVRALSSVARSV